VRLLAPFLTVDVSPLNSHGSVDDHMQAVYFWIFWASVVVGVAVTILLVYGFFRFRRKSDDEEPEQFHGNTRLEITWTLVPFLILVALFVLSAVNMSYVVSAPSNAQTVSVIGQQFSWTYYYEAEKGADGKVVSSSVGLASNPLDTSSVMFVPADTPMTLKLATADPPSKCGGKGAGGIVPTKGQTFAEAASDLGCGVNHSFYIPSLAGQMNAIPGQVNEMWMDARPGIYYGQCTELCGVGHAQMLIEIVSLKKPEFNCLMAHAQGSTKSATDTITAATLKTCKVKT
jgi:cytochrome c oxidase subunit 2